MEVDIGFRGFGGLGWFRALALSGFGLPGAQGYVRVLGFRV